jgi:hypothetical protein
VVRKPGYQRGRAASAAGTIRSAAVTSTVRSL